MEKVICFLLVLMACSWAAEDSPVVRTPQGGLRGSIITSRLGKSIYSFRGIRYVKAPIGDLRFQAPVPAEPWDGVIDATQDGASCPTSLAPELSPTVSEDCLFLNVYTLKVPYTKTDKKKPVIVLFHPGAWAGFTGTSWLYGPQYLMDHDIVLVTINYRLNVLGFLSANDTVLSGNYGMKDQVLALRWVKQNIAAFGGDPNSVTITGCSAGSASAMLHMVSPMSKGLFHRVIASSGSALTLWTVQKDPFAYAQQLARVLNCPSGTSQQIKDCLMKVDAQKLADSVQQLAVWGNAPGVIFGPVIETATQGERFLVEDPLKSFLSGNFEQVPLMTGITRDELGWAAYDVLRNATWARDINERFEFVAPLVFQYERDTPRSLHISRELRKFYFQNRPIDNSTSAELFKLFRDGVINYGEDMASKVISKASRAPLYYYCFTYQGRYSWGIDSTTSTPYGVAHMDDLLYLFYTNLLAPLFTARDPESKTVEKMTAIWTNFAKTGNPTPKKTQLFNNVIWKPFTRQNLEYMDIGSDLQMKSGLYQDTVTIWAKMLFPELHLDGVKG